ncbi:ankyrin repeat domain-containing protein 36B-like isoform X4 [Cyanistes caeruleus]|uniref:ankyrin repeat domain-containing protein 36B-like isoform X4 n=1 Tax=Cyanistes caeruleus TaxID=156563 RepID=UPI000CDB88DB|nr:ankyrin repeat domain-containing protein 36B-like isoform X4 [Cyanistes caeruleus]
MVLVDLHGAAASADLARLRQHWWLNKHRINSYNPDKQTPLHLACINGHADVVQFLVEKKCKLNPCDKLNKSPLMKAVEHQHKDCAAILLEHGANHDHRDVNGNTALHFAVMVSSKSLVELLLEHGADINAKNKFGYTPLTLAVTENCEEMVKFLLQKGADVNAQDNIYRSPLTVATVSGNKKTMQLLLHHGAVLPESDMGLYLCQAFTKMVQNDVIANERIGSSCYETAPVIPLETPVLAESRNVPKEEAAEKEYNGPAASKSKVSVQSITVQPYRGDYKAEGAEKKEEKLSLCNPETDPKGPEKMQASVGLPAANSSRLDARPAAVERSKGVLPAAAAEVKKEDSDSSWGSEPSTEVLDELATTVLLPAGRMFPEPSVAKESIKGASQAAGAAKEKDSDSLCNPKHLSDLREKVINPVLQPAGKCRRVGVRSAAEERGKGVLQPAGGSVKKEDTDSPWDSETDPKGPEKMQASVGLPAANSNRLDARPAAVECSKGVLPAAAAEVKKEDSDSSWGSEPFSKIVEEVFASKWRPAADHKGMGVRPGATECSKGVLQPAGRAGDDDSSWDSETDSEGEGVVLATVQLPAANSSRLDACSAAVERGKGVWKQAWREVKNEDRVLQPAGGEAKQEDNDFPWDSETDSEGRKKVLADVQLPAADQNRVGVSSAAVELSKAARAEQKEHLISSSENKLPTFQGEDLQLQVDSSTQTDSEQDKQPLAGQKLDKILKKNSLEGAPLGTVKTNSRREQKLLLEKLEKCKTRLKDLKELLNKNDYYAESGKNALKEKKVITILRNMQGRLVESFDSSAAAIPQLEERIQRLQIQMAKLEATIQQQAKTMEIFEAIQQISNLSFPREGVGEIRPCN